MEQEEEDDEDDDEEEEEEDAEEALGSSFDLAGLVRVLGGRGEQEGGVADEEFGEELGERDVSCGRCDWTPCTAHTSAS